MTYLKIIFLVIVGVCAGQAWAFACNSYPDHNSVVIKGVIGEEHLIPRCPDGVMNPKNPTIFFFSSPGGNIDKIIQFTEDLREQLQGAYEMSHAIPTVVIYNQCESACIPVLSALNLMAKAGQIRLIVDRMTIMGFHGCSDHANKEDPGHYSVEGTQRYINYWIYQGGNKAWIDAFYDQFFNSEKIREMRPTNSRLAGASLLNYAEIADTSMLR